MKYLIANWKCHKKSSDVQNWVTETKQAGITGKNKALELVICPPFIHLSLLRNLLPEIQLGVQTLSPFSDGAYTGAVSALMVSEFAQYAILGHTERRQYFGETDQIVANQALQALDNSMTPIVALEKKNWSSQLSQFDPGQLKKILVMYEPSEAISTSGGEAADLHDVQQTAQLIRGGYPIKGFLYGGSVTAENVGTYMHAAGVDGVVVGAASLDAHSFIHLYHQFGI